MQERGRDVGRDDEILWNFEKFVVDRKGDVVGRFAPSTPPDDPSLVGAIEKFKTGNSRVPALSPKIMDLVREAWLMASVCGRR